MAFTTEDRTDIIALAVGVWGAAPGATALTDLAVQFQNGATLQEVTAGLVASDIFKAEYPAFQTNEEFAAEFVGNVVGGQVSAADEQWAVDQITGQLNAGASKTDVILAALDALRAVPEDDANWGDASAAFSNKIEVAEYYSVALERDGTLAELKGVVENVDETDASVTTAKEELDESTPTSGEIFVLTADQDTLTGTADDDVFNAGAAQDGAGNLIETLQGVDAINGGQGSDTLNATVLSATTITPSLTSVENVNARFTTTAGGELSLSAATGVQKATIANSTVAGTISGVGAAALAVANQTAAATFEDSTSSSLTLDATNVATAAGGDLVIAADSATADRATSLTLNTTSSKVDLDSTNNDAYESVTVNATGSNDVTLTDVAGVATSLTVTGSGSVDFSGVALTAVSSITAGDGGVEIDATGNTATSLTATTGAGDDDLTLTGANLASASTGAGDDSLEFTTALAATSTVDAGAGDDTVSFGAAPTAGATIGGGDGTDTLAFVGADFVTVSAYTAAERAKITGFETLAITDALVDGTTYNVGSLSGITNFNAMGGVAALATATVAGIGADSTVTYGGPTTDGVLVVSLEDDTGSDDSVTLVSNNDYTDNNDTTADAVALTQAYTATGIETVNLVSTADMNAFVPVDGYKADVVTNTVTLTNDDLVTLNISGDKKASITTAGTMTDLEEIDASENTAGVTIDASAAAAASPALAITGTANADTISGGANGDTITLGDGNDVVDYNVGGESEIGTGAFDTILDFDANTFGSGTAGAAGDGETAGAQAQWTGDVLRFTADADGAAGGVKADVLNTAADATTFLSNNAGSAEGLVAALDASTGNLYVDNTNDGVADFYIQLTGVSTIDEAAFALV